MLKITTETDEGTEVVELSAEQQKAFEFVAVNPAEWIRNLIYNRIRQAVDQIVDETTDKNYKKTDITKKLLIVKDADIKSAKVRTDEFENSLVAKGELLPK